MDESQILCTTSNGIAWLHHDLCQARELWATLANPKVVNKSLPLDPNDLDPSGVRDPFYVQACYAIAMNALITTAHEDGFPDMVWCFFLHWIVKDAVVISVKQLC